MATLTTFSALIPQPEWFARMLPKLSLLQRLLEHSQDPAEKLSRLLIAGNYSKPESESLYIYEQETASGSQFGVWGCTSLDDFYKGKIIMHESTLEESQEKLRQYRQTVGLEGSPILLTYQTDADIDQLIEKVTHQDPESFYSDAGICHRLWPIKDPASQKNFLAAFSKIGAAYVADGHHRLAAAVGNKKDASQWISTLYVSSGQLRCREFHRMVVPEKEYTKKQLMEAVSQNYYVSEIPGNVPFRPKKEGRLGLYHKGMWYQLDLKSSQIKITQQIDVITLQKQILEPVFGISNPRTDTRLSCWSARRWEGLLEQSISQPNAIIFTMAAISIDKLCHFCDNGVKLPPKSTYIEPKIPYGLLMNQISKD